MWEVTVRATGPEGSIAVTFDTNAPGAALLANRGVGRRVREAYRLMFESDSTPTLSADPILVNAVAVKNGAGSHG